MKNKLNELFCDANATIKNALQNLGENARMGSIEAMDMKESRFVEFKEEVSNSFLKTVSAYANFGQGKILFGIKDNGEVTGINEPKDVCLQIENKINDNISPKPEFTLSIERKVIVLTVNEGLDKPYFYKGKAYRRSDTATVEVDSLELKRLALEGTHQYYEELTYRHQNLDFTVLENKLKEKIGISTLNADILRTFGLLDNQGSYNNAAALFADTNSFAGIDMVRFGENISIFLDRETVGNTSILKQYDKAVEMYTKYYQYEMIEGFERVKKELIPEAAFREAIVNALVHRTWDLNAHIKVSMFNDRIEICSPGGLPKGITKEEYLYGNISNLRNPLLANVLFRMHYVEMFGTGIHRIRQAYKGYTQQPEFEVFENTIKVTLPVLSTTYKTTTNEQKVVDLLSGGKLMTSREVSASLKVSKDTAIRLLNALLEKKYIKITGNGRGTKYSLN